METLVSVAIENMLSSVQEKEDYTGKTLHCSLPDFILVDIEDV